VITNETVEIDRGKIVWTIVRFLSFSVDFARVESWQSRNRAGSQKALENRGRPSFVSSYKVIPMDPQAETKSAFKLLLICSAITVLLWFVPFAGVITYPFRMFVTLIHESGHAVAALLTLGQVRRITLDWNGSGLTETVGGIGLFISSAGYIGATLFGAVLLLILRRAANARLAALLTGCLILLITVFLGGNFAAWVAGLLFGFGLLALGIFATRKFTHFFMSFLGVQSVLNALFDLKTVVYLSTYNPGVPTDAQNMARATGNWLPAVVWSFGWAVLALTILAGTLFLYYRSLKQTAPPIEVYKAAGAHA